MKLYLFLIFCFIGFNVFSAEGNVKISEVTDETFAQAIDSGLVMVDFWATWCGPCVHQGREIEKLATSVSKYLKIYKMDVDKNTQIPSRFIVTSIPTLIIFKDGKMVKRLVGFRGQAELEEEVQKFR